MGTRVAIIQSSYIPWKGYLDIVRACDRFLLYDEVQYTRRDWRNRNRIRTAQGTIWLTIPVQVKGRYTQRIDETLVADGAWAAKHWRTIRQAYAGAPHFAEIEPALGAAYEQAAELERLSDVNRLLLEALCGLLAIETPLQFSSELASDEGRSERLLSLCLACGADTYVSGPAARAYLDERVFAEAGVRVEYADYDGYPEYQQLHDGGFEHGVSVIDLLANVGPGAAARTCMRDVVPVRQS